MLDLFSDIYTQLLSIFGITVRLAVPLIFAALGGLFAERSGIVDIGLEGKMLAGAFTAAALSHVLVQSGVPFAPLLALLAAVLVSVLLSLVHGFAAIHQKGDQIISGLAINFFAAGLTIVLGNSWFREGGKTPSLAPEGRFGVLDLPGANWMYEHVPVLGGFYKKVLSGHNILTYLAFGAVFLSWFIVFKTRFGLRLRAVGEEPKAIDTAGLNVAALRYKALILTGVFCAFGGTYLAIGNGANFSNNMTAGRGYIALAALIFGKWKPRTTLLACMLFGFFFSLKIALQGRNISLVAMIIGFIILLGVLYLGLCLLTKGRNAKTQGLTILTVGGSLIAFLLLWVLIFSLKGLPLFFEALPYALTVILLAGFIGETRAPKAVGQPYMKER